ncbi:CGNR zinc finger domain-containing protein [Streptomyces sp. NPDC096354]|uniref:CGNR zinc finger domain-containing protein n=1 Tax=Streptomyces sp. NPDC096354 TaxID=3366088 RepID=UPI00381D39F6
MFARAFVTCQGGDADHAFPGGTVALDFVRTLRAPAIPQLTPVGHRIEATPQQALSSVARDAIDILSEVDMPLLKERAHPACAQIYIDRSREGRGERCATDPCGNKIKAAAYRARRPASVATRP